MFESFQMLTYRHKYTLGGIDFFTSEFGDDAWIEAVNEANETPLHVAARNNNPKTFKIMWRQCTRRRIEATNNAGNTVLHNLVDHSVEKKARHRKERVKLILSILSKGVDVNKRNKSGWTIVHFAAKHCHLDLLKSLDKTIAKFELRTFANETPLILACKNMFKIKDDSKTTKMIDFLLDRVFDINAVDEEEYSALHYALESCSCKVLTKLLKHGADVHLRTKEHSLTPLHFAAIKEENSLPTVKMLLNAGALIESPENDELTPLHMSLLGDSSDVVEYLIENGGDVNRLERNLQFTPLHMAIYQQRYDLFQLLVTKGADVNGMVVDGLTPLHLASMLGCPQFTEALISLGAKVGCLYDNHLTPLHVASLMSHVMDDDKLVAADAIKRGKEKSLISKLLTYCHNPPGRDYEDVIQLLLHSGADAKALTKNGWSSLLFAAKNSRHTGNFVKILLNHGAEVDHREPHSGFTALHLATQNNLDALVEVLVNSGADVNAVTHDGRKPVHLALRSDCTKVLKLLIKMKANVNCSDTQLQLTPLHVALEKKYNDAARILIDAGADVNALTLENKSPMHLALQSDNLEILNIMLKRGAKLNCKGKRCLKTFLSMSANNSDDVLIDKLYDLGKISFLFSSNSLENREMKKLFNLLSVIVDTFDEIGCMSGNPRFEKDQFMDSEFLRKRYGVKINDLAAYWKFSAGLILCDAFRENTSSIGIETSTDNLAKYLYMLNAAKLPVTDDTYRKIEPRFPEYLSGNLHYDEKCRDEARLLYTYSVSDDVSLYNVLHMKPSRRRFYTKNLNLREIEEQFEIYYKLVSSCYREDTIKKTLMETVQSAMYQLISIQVPILCIEKIFYDLNIMSIIATIDAAGIMD